MAAHRRERFEAEALGFLSQLFRVARRVLGDTAAAEDVVQETYLRAWQSYDRFESGSNCRAWLYKIMFRVIGGRRQELQREMALLDQHALELDHAPPAADALSALQIERAFQQLPVGAATVIQMIDVEGLTYREAADALDVPVGTVMSRLHRGRRQLRQRLAPNPALVKLAREAP